MEVIKIHYSKIQGRSLNLNLLVASFLFLSANIFGQLPDGFNRERVASGLNPTSIAIAPDGRILITEKNGKVRVIRDGNLVDEPLLTIEVDDTNERGLGHIVLHPDFESNGFFYLYYTVPVIKKNRVSRFTAIGDNAIPGSELILLDLDETGSDIHNGGAMVFGLDGLLYISTGEGAQGWKSEDLGSTNGKVLRVDDMGVPSPDNPWYNLNTGRSNLVYAYGLRNPFTMTLNPFDGSIFVGDVGNNKFEEINKIEKGAFYGWPRVEGKSNGEDLPDEYQDPFYQYEHKDNYCCVAGASFYNPQVNQFPEMYSGILFYSDYCTGHIHMLDVDSGLDKGIFLSDGDRVVDIAVGPDGSLFYLERKGRGDGSQEDNTSTQDGTLWKVLYAGSGKPNISVEPQNVLVSEGENAIFSVIASGAQPLHYRWFFNNQENADQHNDVFTIENVTLDQNTFAVYVIVENGAGADTSSIGNLFVTTNKRPQPEIKFPLEGQTYSGGSNLYFEGTASDVEDGIIPGAQLSWKIDFIHASHAHPAMPWTNGVASGNWMVPLLGETSTEVKYRVYLKATDAQGLSKIVYRDVIPSIGKVHVASVPDHLIISLDGSLSSTPYQFEGVAGMERYISPPLKQALNDSIYFFDKWEDGSKLINRQIEPTQDERVYTGIFKGIVKPRGHGLTARYFSNIDFTGTPVVTRVDSIINYQYFMDAPDPLLPADNFSIRWSGYVQAYHAGYYDFAIIADDGIYFKIDDKVLINKLEPGVHTEHTSFYMESDRLYPVELKMFDGLFNSQVKLRWAATDFKEEVIPSSQMFAEDYLKDPDHIGLLTLRTISDDELLIITGSYKATKMDFMAVSVIGQVFISEDVEIKPGQNEIPFDISRLPAGLYFLTGYDNRTGEKYAERFVKIN